MYYGTNFGALPIPPELLKVFPKRLNKALRKVGGNVTAEWMLEGVASSVVEINEMQILADNGRRKFHLRQDGNWIALYIGWKD